MFLRVIHSTTFYKSKYKKYMHSSIEVRHFNENSLKLTCTVHCKSIIKITTKVTASEALLRWENVQLLAMRQGRCMDFFFFTERAEPGTGSGTRGFRASV